MAEASLLAEVTVQRAGGDTRIEQYALGFNSRGLSLGYQRNRFEGESAVGILSTGLGVPFRRGTMGVTASRYSLGFPLEERDRFVSRVGGVPQ